MSDNSEDYVNCTVLYERFSKCMSVGTQIHSIHRYGLSKDCGEMFSDWTTCLHTKLIKDPERIKEMFANTSYYKEKKTQVNDVFVYKEKPSWEM